MFRVSREGIFPGGRKMSKFLAGGRRLPSPLLEGKRWWGLKFGEENEQIFD